MADPVLDRLRADRPAPPPPVDVDQLWEAGRQRRLRSVVSTIGGSVAVALVAVLVLPGVLDLPGTGGLPPIVGQPDDGTTGAVAEGSQLVLGPEALWVAPTGPDPGEAASAFLAAMEPRWGEYIGGGIDVPEDVTETVETVGEDGGIPIRVHLFRKLDAPERWYVVAVDTETAPLDQDDGRAVVPVEPVPTGAATLTLDLAVPAGDGPSAVTGPVDQALLEEARDVLDAAAADGSVTAALLRYRDADGRLLDARGATFAGRWADIVAADTSSSTVAMPDDYQPDPHLVFEDDAVWTSPSVPGLETAARTFGWHTFGWDDVEVTGELGDGPTWVEIADAAGTDAAVDILLSPDPVHHDAWHVLQVGDGQLTIRTGMPPILEFGPVPENAALAEVLAGSHRALEEQELTGADLATGRTSLSDDPGQGEVTSALVRFRDADGRLIGTIGRTFADQPGLGINLPPDGPYPDPDLT
jgi:hypothetical protein